MLSLSKKPLIMGILNITPDSFSDGGKYFEVKNAISHIQELIKSGVDIIDIGGESTRPGAVAVSEEEEFKRVIPVVKELFSIRNRYRTGETARRRDGDFLISIDTYKSNVAQKAIEAGADMINDVSGLTMDPKMVNVAAKNNCPIVIMHNTGIPAKKPPVNDCRGVPMAHPADIIQKIYGWLKKQADFAIKHGVKKENIIIDPGLGFGKTPEEDFYIIQNLSEFKSLGYPILIGPSRKSFIKKLASRGNWPVAPTDIEKKSKEITDLAIKNGADIVRIHINP